MTRRVINNRNTSNNRGVAFSGGDTLESSGERFNRGGDRNTHIVNYNSGEVEKEEKNKKFRLKYHRYEMTEGEKIFEMMSYGVQSSDSDNLFSQ